MKSGFWLGGLVALLLACNGGDDDGAAAPGTSRASDADLDEFIQLICDQLRSCCEAAGSTTTAGVDDCETEMAGYDLFEALRRGTAVLVDPGYSECVEQLRDSDCSELRIANPDGCGAYFQGTVAEGGGCGDVVECARGSAPVVCVRAGGVPDEQPGVCRALARARAGEACMFNHFAGSYGTSISTPESESSLTLTYCDLGEGLFCSQATSTCQPLIGEGGTCEAQACEPDLYCEATCQRKKPEGTACTRSEECAAPALLCVAGQCSLPQAAYPQLCEGGFD